MVQWLTAPYRRLLMLPVPRQQVSVFKTIDLHVACQASSLTYSIPIVCKPRRERNALKRFVACANKDDNQQPTKQRHAEDDD